MAAARHSAQTGPRRDRLCAAAAEAAGSPDMARCAQQARRAHKDAQKGCRSSPQALQGRLLTVPSGGSQELRVWHLQPLQLTYERLPALWLRVEGCRWARSPSGACAGGAPSVVCKQLSAAPVVAHKTHTRTGEAAATNFRMLLSARGSCPHAEEPGPPRQSMPCPSGWVFEVSMLQIALELPQG